MKKKLGCLFVVLAVTSVNAFADGAQLLLPGSGGTFSCAVAPGVTGVAANAEVPYTLANVTVDAWGDNKNPLLVGQCYSYARTWGAWFNKGLPWTDRMVGSMTSGDAAFVCSTGCLP